MKKTSLVYIILASVLWGTSGIFVNFMSPYGFTSTQMTLIRSITAFLCIGGYILFADRSLFKASFKEILLFAGSGIGFFGTATCYFYSMQLTSIATAVVLMYTAPVLVMIYSVTFLGEKLTKTKVLCVVLMLLGCGLVSGVIGGLKFHLFGIIIGFLAGISYSAYNIFTKIQMRNGSRPLTANFYCFLVALIASMFVSNPCEMPSCIAINPPLTISLAIGMGIITCILPYVFYTLALKKIPAGTASSLAIIEPMSATVFSILFFNENLTLASFLGIILILGSVLVLSRQKA